MAASNYKTKIDLIRDNAIIGTAFPVLVKGAEEMSISTSSSIYNFPIAIIKSSNPEVNSLFMSFSKLDIMRILVSNDNFSTNSLLFEGEFYTKSMNIANKNEVSTLKLDLQGIHSFFKLSLLKLSSTQQFNGIKFHDFVHTVAKLAGIVSPIVIENTLGDSIVNGISNKTNAFRLFKEVCLLKNAVVMFNKDNSVNIDFRSDKLKLLRSKVPITVQDKDILSFKIDERI